MARERLLKRWRRGITSRPDDERYLSPSSLYTLSLPEAAVSKLDNA